MVVVTVTSEKSLVYRRYCSYDGKWQVMVKGIVHLKTVRELKVSPSYARQQSISADENKGYVFLRFLEGYPDSNLFSHRKAYNIEGVKGDDGNTGNL